MLYRAKQERNSMLIDKLILPVVTIRKENTQEREQEEIAAQYLAFMSICIDISKQCKLLSESDCFSTHRERGA